MNIYSIKNKGIAGNIWKFAILYITNKRPYMTFLTIFLLLMPNTTAQTIGLLTALGQIVGVALEIPSGYISDKIGHKNALIIAKIAYLISTLFYIFATSQIYFFAATVFFAIGIAMLSGTTSTYLKESLNYLGRSSEYSSISGKLRSFGFAVPILLILLVSFIAESNYQLAFIVVGITDIIGLITVLSLYSVPKEIKVEEFNFKKKDSIFKKYFSFGWIPYVFAVEIIMGITFGATIGFKNPFQESIGISIGTLGILWAVSRLGISGLLLINGWIKKHFNFGQFILMQGLFFSFSLLLVGLASNRWIIALGFILSTMTMWGLSSVKSHFYLEFLEGHRYQASMLSMNAFIQKIIIGMSGFVMGYSVYYFGNSNSYAWFGSIVGGLSIFFYILLKNKKSV